MADRGSDGRVMSTPNIKQVKHYESMICKDVAKRMNDGQSWWPAMQEATARARLLQVHFLSPVARRSSHAFSAPGVAPFHLADQAVNPKRAFETSEQKPPGGGVAPNKNTERKKPQRTNQQQRYNALQDVVRNPRADAPPKAPQGQQLAVAVSSKGAGTGQRSEGTESFPSRCPHVEPGEQWPLHRFQHVDLLPSGVQRCA